MYNCQIIKYPHGYQIRLHSQPCGPYPDPDADKYTLEQLAAKDKRQRAIKSWQELTGNIIPGVLSPEWIFEHSQDDIDMVMQAYADAAKRSLYSSLARTKNRVYYLARSNDWDWFVTLTFDPNIVDSYDYAACTSKLSNWFIMMRRKCPDMRYIVVPELHKSGRWHYHGLFAACDNLGFVDSGHKDKHGNTIYNVGNYRLGFTTATRVQDPARVTVYIGKYITKEVCAVTKGKKRYWCSRNLQQAEIDKRYYGPQGLQLLLQQLTDVADSVRSCTVEGIGTTYYIEMSEEWSDE